MKNKRLTKKVFSIVASLALALVMVVGFAFAPAAQVSAAAPKNAAAFGKDGSNATVKSAEELYKKVPGTKTSGYDFNKIATYESSPIQLSGTPTNVPISESESSYVFFTTAAASDYVIEFTAFSGWIDVYNANTESFVEQRDTEWYDGYEWQQREVMTFALGAETTYRFEIRPYEPYADAYNPSSVQMAAFKVSADDSVKSIEVVAPTGKINCFNLLDASDVSYKVTFGDNTRTTVSYDVLCSQCGYDIEFYTSGTTVYFNGETVMRAVDTPVIVVYNDGYSSAVVRYNSVTDNLRSGGTDVFEIDYEYATIYESQGDGAGTGWLIKSAYTGYYGWSSYYNELASDVLYDWSAVMLDEQNNIVKFDEKSMSWPLVKGRDYAFSLLREFNYGEYSYSFEFDKNADTIYPDTSKSGWYHDAVTYVTGRGIMSGYSNGKFGTSDGIQRQDFLVMLSRLANVDLEEYMYKSDFPDVKAGSYYEAAVNWGAENGIVTGYQNGEFGVGDKITREQIVTFLYRYAENWCGVDTSVSSSAENNASRKYSDYRKVSAFAKAPMLWALENGVLSGKTASTIVPHGNAQRCEVAKIMYNIFLNDLF